MVNRYPLAQRAKALLGSRAAVHMLHEMDKAAQHVRPRSSPLPMLVCLCCLRACCSCVPTFVQAAAASEARVRALRLDEAANRLGSPFRPLPLPLPRTSRVT